jgi:error-prone DNA polymerase
MPLGHVPDAPAGRCVLWPDRFETSRRQVMSSSMTEMRGRLQKEGEVIHVICDRTVDYDAMLSSIARSNFTAAPGRGDRATHGGGPDPRDEAFPRGRTLRNGIAAGGDGTYSHP